MSPFWKAARVGERLSPYVAVACVVMAVSLVSSYLVWIIVWWGGVQCDEGGREEENAADGRARGWIGWRCTKRITRSPS